MHCSSRLWITALLCFGCNIHIKIYCAKECENYIKIERFSRTTTILNTTDEWLANYTTCLNKAANSGNTRTLVLRSSDVTIGHLIDTLASNSSQKIRTLDFEGNRISSIWMNAFKQFTIVDHIKLRKNQIQNLSEGSFNNLIKLRKIDLSDNMLVKVMSKVFCNLPSLREIHLSNNKIKYIADDAFKSTPKVFKIDDVLKNLARTENPQLLGSNMLEEIPCKAFIKTSLQELDVSGNNLTEIGDDIRQLQLLKILDVVNNSLQHVSKNIATLQNMLHLYLGHNNLSSLPKEMEPMVKATVVRGLGSNPWRCDCKLYWMIQLVILDVQYGTEIQCSEPVNIDMSEINLERLTCHSKEYKGIRVEFLVVGIAVSLAGICASISAVCLWKKRNIRPRRHIRMLINAKYYQPTTSVVESSNESVVLNSGNESLLIPDVKDKWEHCVCENTSTFGRLQIGKLLGRGAFGDVYEGFTFGYDSMQEKVAVKKIRDTVDGAENLSKELQNMKEIGIHSNIIQIYGSGYIRGCPIIVMELAEHGDLLAYLHRTEIEYHTEIQNLEKWEEKSYVLDKIPRLFTIMWHVAKGMEYMSQMKIVHRDLAARNILLAEKYIAKISDFGLSRDVYESGVYSQKSKGRLPYKWMSPETLSTGKYTTKSDVWSYGVLLWEVVTLGSSPYPGIPPHMLINMYSSGYIMPQPPLCPANIYSVMERCWKYSPDDRPMFRSIAEYLYNLLQLGYNKEYPPLVDSETEQ